MNGDSGMRYIRTLAKHMDIEFIDYLLGQIHRIVFCTTSAFTKAARKNRNPGLSNFRRITCHV
jgi:hypothetical protein